MKGGFTSCPQAIFSRAGLAISCLLDRIASQQWLTFVFTSELTASCTDGYNDKVWWVTVGVRWGLDDVLLYHLLSQQGSDTGVTAVTVGVKLSFIKLPRGGACVVGTLSIVKGNLVLLLFHWGWALCLGYSQMGIQEDIVLPTPRALEAQGTQGLSGLDLVVSPDCPGNETSQKSLRALGRKY